MEEGAVLRSNLDRLHTTKLGNLRIRENLGLDVEDVVSWCARRIAGPGCRITRKGKNWYAEIGGCVITVNAHSYTVITAHKL